jgi:hypothetical protein
MLTFNTYDGNLQKSKENMRKSVEFIWDKKNNNRIL